MVLQWIKEHKVTILHWNLDAILWEHKVVQHHVLVSICGKPTQQCVEEVRISVSMAPVLKATTKLCEDSSSKSGHIELANSLAHLLKLW